MTLTVDEIGKYLGKTIEDSMGRPTGKLVGLTADFKDEVTAIQVAQSNGEVSQYPISFVRLVDGHPVLLQTWRVEAEDLRREHDVIKRRNQAIDLLLKDGDIEQPEYNQLRNTYEDVNKEINQKRDTLLDTLKEVEGKLDQQIRDLQSALTNNKMLYTASEINEETYHAVTESIRSGLEIARKERKDLDNIYEYLQAIDSLETPPTMPPSVPARTVPDIVVIKMKESA
jgi:chromosome segregation ATPase